MEDRRPSSDAHRSALLADPALRSALAKAVRRRVPESDVDDVVQATLVEALAAKTAPADPAELRLWVYGILRHKVADLHRRRRRESLIDPGNDETAAESAPISARELLQWAEQELPAGEHGKNTLEWMIREGHGEKLETIAREERVPAPRVRQRIARLRRHFRERWAAQLAAAVGLLGLVAGLLLWMRHRSNAVHPVPIAREPMPPVERAREMRRFALEECARARYRSCLDGLDRAKTLDPIGDEDDDVRAARQQAASALTPPAPSTTATVAPTSSAAPPAPRRAPRRTSPKPAPASTDSFEPAPPRSNPSKPRINPSIDLDMK